VPDRSDVLAALRARGPLVSAGAFAGDLAHLGETVRTLEHAGAQLIHLDVADGRYSPLMIGGQAEVAAVRTDALKDLHLMIEEPIRHVTRFAAAGADAITIHLDADRHPIATLRAIGVATNANAPERPVLRGVCVGLHEPVAVIEPLLEEIDLVLVLAVVPGHAGTMASTTVGRIRAVRRLLDNGVADALLSVDGGITLPDAPALVAAGADIVVSGSALFAGTDPAATFGELSAAVAAAAPPV
jgi:ribulose-phosphate 3-epimerase